jgi:hypothetical protein
MPSFKSIFTLCTFLLFISIPHEYVSAQSNEPKIEVGAQFSALGGAAGSLIYDPYSVGGGGRLTYNLTKSLALEGELNYLPSAGFNNISRFQGQFGVKSGLRFDRFGVFGKARPGFIHTDYDSWVLCIGPPCTVDSRDTGFSLDIGGVLEFYPTKRMVVRFDAGDTIVNHEAPSFLDSAGFVTSGRNYATHTLQLSAGVGFRF